MPGFIAKYLITDPPFGYFSLHRRLSRIIGMDGRFVTRTHYLEETYADNLITDKEIKAMAQNIKDPAGETLRNIPDKYLSDEQRATILSYYLRENQPSHLDLVNVRPVPTPLSEEEMRKLDERPIGLDSIGE